MKAYMTNLDARRPSATAIAEAAEVNQVMALRLNQALIGELTPAAALNEAAKPRSRRSSPARPQDRKPARARRVGPGR